MQAVQTRTCLRTPSTKAFTRRRFGFQRRRRTLWAWLMVFPKLGFLPQTSHTSAIVTLHPLEILNEYEFLSYQRLRRAESYLAAPGIFRDGFGIR